MTFPVTKPSPSWQEKAGCKGLPSDLFFLDCSKHEVGTYKTKLKNTQDICAQCEVLRDCFKYATANDECYGVWGGVDFQTRGKPNRNRARRLRFLYIEHQKVLRKAEQARRHK